LGGGGYFVLFVSQAMLFVAFIFPCPLIWASQAFLAFFDFFIGLHLQLSAHLHSASYGQFLPRLHFAAVAFVSQALVVLESATLQQWLAKASDTPSVAANSSFFSISISLFLFAVSL
jgi:hypothetical protein